MFQHRFIVLSYPYGIVQPKHLTRPRAVQYLAAPAIFVLCMMRHRVSVLMNIIAID